MARLRFWSVALLALALTGNASQRGRTAGQGMASGFGSETLPKPDCSCVIYSLSERGFDAEMGKWIADTVREVIEPESWRNAASLRYYAPKNILVVNHTTAVHGKIERFLKEMKTTVAKSPEPTVASYKKAPSEGVVPAAYRQLAAPPEPSGYPVPAPVKAPKHLFHFLIRYEGEGIIDDNVVKYLKIQNQAEKKEKSGNGTSTSYATTMPNICVPYGPAVSSPPMPMPMVTPVAGYAPSSYMGTTSPGMTSPGNAPAGGSAPLTAGTSGSAGTVYSPSSTAPVPSGSTGVEVQPPKENKIDKKDEKRK